jgi:outer membrane lipoprotein-sorting protein
MRCCLTGLALLPFLSLSANAAPALDGGVSEAEAVLDRAIKACGGQETIAKLQVVVKATSTTILRDGVTSHSIDYQISWQRPDRVRLEYSPRAAAKTNYVRVIDGDGGWLSLNGAVRELPKTPLSQYGPEWGVEFAAELLTFKGKAYKLTALGKVKIDNQTVVGVKVAREGVPDVTLYFDRDTNLLLKRVVTIPSPAAGGQDTQVEIEYADYKEAEKIKYASKVTIIRNGKNKTELNITEFKTVDKLEDSLFKKPE